MAVIANTVAAWQRHNRLMPSQSVCGQRPQHRPGAEFRPALYPACSAHRHGLRLDSYRMGAQSLTRYLLVVVSLAGCADLGSVLN